MVLLQSFYEMNYTICIDSDQHRLFWFFCGAWQVMAHRAQALVSMVSLPPVCFRNYSQIKVLTKQERVWRVSKWVPSLLCSCDWYPWSNMLSLRKQVKPIIRGLHAEAPASDVGQWPGERSRGGSSVSRASGRPPNRGKAASSPSEFWACLWDGSFSRQSS